MVLSLEQSEAIVQTRDSKEDKSFQDVSKVKNSESHLNNNNPIWKIFMAESLERPISLVLCVIRKHVFTVSIQ